LRFPAGRASGAERITPPDTEVTSRARTEQFTSETDPRRRVQLWTKLQALFYAEAPAVRPGAFFNVMLSRKGLQGFDASHWTTLWNVQPVR